jgi:hypothetical protein
MRPVARPQFARLEGLVFCVVKAAQVSGKTLAGRNGALKTQTSSMVIKRFRYLAFVGTFVIASIAAADSKRVQGPPPPPLDCNPVPGTLSYRGLLSGCSEGSSTPCFAGEAVRFQFTFTNPYLFQSSYAWLPEGGSTPIFTAVPELTHRYSSSGNFLPTVIVFACVPHPTVASQTLTVVNSAAIPAVTREGLAALALCLALLASTKLR